MQCLKCRAENEVSALECGQCGHAVGLGVAVQPLKDALAHSEQDVAIKAAEALGCFPDAAVSAYGAGFLARGLDGFEYPSFAAIALGRIPDEASKQTAALYAARNLASGEHKMPWSRVLISTDRWPDEVVDLLLTAMESSNRRVAAQAIEALGHCPNPAAINRLCEFTQSDDLLRSYWACRSLCASGSSEHWDEGPAILLEYLSDGVLDAERVGLALAACPDASIRGKGLELLAGELSSADDGSVEPICEAIAKAGGRDAGAILANAILKCRFGSLPFMDILGAMRHLPADARATVGATLRGRWGSLGINAQMAAANAWAACGYQEAIPLLQPFLACGNDDAEGETREALARLGVAKCVDDVAAELAAELRRRPGARDELEERMAHAHRTELARVLGDVCDVNAALIGVPVLSDALGDADEKLAECAAVALGKIALTIQAAGSHTADEMAMPAGAASGEGDAGQGDGVAGGPTPSPQLRLAASYLDDVEQQVDSFPDDYYSYNLPRTGDTGSYLSAKERRIKAILNGPMADAFGILDQMRLADAPPPEEASLTERAYLLRGRLWQAISCSELGVASTYKGMGWVNTGEIEQRNHALASAETDYRSSVRLSQDRVPTAIQHLAEVLYAQERYDDALAELQVVVDKYPDSDAAIAVMKAQAQIRKGKELAAQRQAREAQEEAVRVRTATMQSAPKTSGGCFIATACYGSYDHPDVLVFRRFRDDQLLPSRLGRLAVAAYYAVSPRVAHGLASMPWVSDRVRRTILEPLAARLRRS